jgi:hypothetical protein
MTGMKLSSHGWNMGVSENCLIDVFYLGDEVPEFSIKQEEGLSFSTKLKVNLKCRHNPSDPVYYHVFTMLTQKIKFTGALIIKEGFVIKVDNLDFDI